MDLCSVLHFHHLHANVLVWCDDDDVNDMRMTIVTIIIIMNGASDDDDDCVDGRGYGDINDGNNDAIVVIIIGKLLSSLMCVQMTFKYNR